MKKFYELNILVYDKEEYSIISSSTKYYCSKKLYFSSIEEIQKNLPNILKDIENWDEEVINIYSIEYDLDTSFENQENGYTFFDKSANIISKISKEQIEESKPLKRKNKFKKGDFVYIVNRTYTVGEKNIEFGIISQTPDDEICSNFYNILIGTEIHNHTHEIEEFLIPYDENINYEIHKKTMKDRLENLGY